MQYAEKGVDFSTPSFNFILAHEGVGQLGMQTLG